MDVLQDEHEGAVPRDRLDQLAERPENVSTSRRGRRPTEHRADDARDRVAVGLVTEYLRETLGRVRSSCVRDLAERPEGDPLAVCQATPLERNGLVSERPDELADESGLPDARVAENGQEPRRSFTVHLLEHVAQAAQLGPAPDERGVCSALEGLRVRKQRDEPPVAGEPTFPGGRRRLLHQRRVPDETVCRLPEEDVARCRQVTQAQGPYDRIAADRARRSVARQDDLTAVDADARLNRGLGRALQVGPGEGLAPLTNRPNRPERVVLVRGRYAEDGQDTFADVALGGSSVPLACLLVRRERV